MEITQFIERLEINQKRLQDIVTINSKMLYAAKNKLGMCQEEGCRKMVADPDRMDFCAEHQATLLGMGRAG